MECEYLLELRTEQKSVGCDGYAPRNRVLEYRRMLYSMRQAV